MLTLENLLILIIGILATWTICHQFFSHKIRKQTRQMVQLMKSDEAKLSQPGDLYTDDDGHFFSDLERASLNLRRKYLRLKKNSADERAVYETIFSGLREAVVTFDADLKIISFNTAFMQQFQWAPLSIQSSIVDKNFFLHEVIRDPEVLDLFKLVFKKPILERQNKGNSQLFVTLLPAVEDHKIWALAVFYDMTEIQKAEKMRVDFVANASHELRTPLTVIRGYADLLNTQLQKTQNQSLLDLSKPILENAHHMTLLVNDLLNLSRLDHLNKIEKIKINIKEVSTDIINELEPIMVMNHKKVKCTFEAEYVYADYSSLTQIMRNLIVNAIRYSGSDPKAEIIEMKWSESHSGIHLSLKDFGPGIPAEHLSRIFERFYRIDKGRNRSSGGSGLGLALVKHHMQIHQGQIHVKSDPFLGCEFICDFPKDIHHV